jgi:hypothetical protein
MLFLELLQSVNTKPWIIRDPLLCWSGSENKLIFKKEAVPSIWGQIEVVTLTANEGQSALELLLNTLSAKRPYCALSCASLRSTCRRRQNTLIHSHTMTSNGGGGRPLGERVSRAVICGELRRACPLFQLSHDRKSTAHNDEGLQFPFPATKICLVSTSCEMNHSMLQRESSSLSLLLTRAACTFKTSRFGFASGRIRRRRRFAPVRTMRSFTFAELCANSWRRKWVNVGVLYMCTSKSLQSLTLRLQRKIHQGGWIKFVFPQRRV